MQQYANRRTVSRAQHATAAAPPNDWPRTATFDRVRAKVPPVCTGATAISIPPSAAVISTTRRLTWSRRQATRAGPTPSSPCVARSSSVSSRSQLTYLRVTHRQRAVPATLSARAGDAKGLEGSDSSTHSLSTRPSLLDVQRQAVPSTCSKCTTTAPCDASSAHKLELTWRQPVKL